MRKIDPRLEISQRRQGRILEPRHVHRDVPRPAQNRLPNRSTYIHIQREVAIELLNIGNELPDEIYRAPRQADLRR